MKYVHYDKDTYEILGFYDKDIHGNNIPNPHIEITDDEWRRMIETGCNKIDINKKKGYKEETINIEELKNNYINRLKELARKAIINNFRSNALGSYYYYQNDQHDQLNIVTAANSNISTYIKCSKNKRKWEMIEHTPEELKQLLIDNNIHKENVLRTLEEYKVKIINNNDKETIKELYDKFKSIVDTI